MRELFLITALLIELNKRKVIPNKLKRLKRIKGKEVVGLRVMIKWTG